MEEIDKTRNGISSNERQETSRRDKLRLAKTVLLFSLLTYLAIGSLYIFSDQLLLSASGPIKQVWSFSSQAIFGIVNLLLLFWWDDF